LLQVAAMRVLGNLAIISPSLEHLSLYVHR
jgi:hypothetical protein